MTATEALCSPEVSVVVHALTVTAAMAAMYLLVQGEVRQ